MKDWILLSQGPGGGMMFSFLMESGSVKYGSTSDLDVSAHGDANDLRICESLERSSPSLLMSWPTANMVKSDWSIFINDVKPAIPYLSISLSGMDDNPGGKVA